LGWLLYESILINRQVINEIVVTDHIVDDVDEDLMRAYLERPNKDSKWLMLERSLTEAEPVLHG